MKDSVSNTACINHIHFSDIVLFGEADGDRSTSSNNRVEPEVDTEDERLLTNSTGWNFSSSSCNA